MTVDETRLMNEGEEDEYLMVRASDGTMEDFAALKTSLSTEHSISEDKIQIYGEEAFNKIINGESATV